MRSVLDALFQSVPLPIAVFRFVGGLPHGEMRGDGWLLAVVVHIVSSVVGVATALVNPATTISSPCRTPTPADSSFPIFCQLNYHNVPYVCDPAGIFSRTELEMLDRNVIAPANLTGCFCADDKCGGSARDHRLKVAIATVPVTSINSIGSCDIAMKYVRPLTLHSAALIYTELLATRWLDYCKADLLLVYIQSWNPERIRKPFIVPLYRHRLQHLSHFSRPESVSRYASPYDVLVAELKSATQIIRSGSVEDVATIPVWAWATGGCLLVLMIAAIYIGNCITRRIGNRYEVLQQKSSLTSMRMANDRWRAGFGGGLMTQGTTSMKSSMMFKQFNRRNRHNPSIQKI
uniref:Uncharacterized protein n=1 Tax=Steinernema glaseri TaxID=37863 RepID=A0A1I8AVU5_9BILA